MKNHSHHDGSRHPSDNSAAHKHAQATLSAPTLNPASAYYHRIDHQPILTMGISTLSAEQYPYHMAALLNDMSILQELGHGQIEHEDPQGATPLYYAILSRSIDTIRHLLECGADQNHANHYGITPLMIADQLNDCDVILLLKQIIKRP